MGKTDKNPVATLVMQVIITVVLLALASYLIVKNPNEASQKTGYSLLGLATGYWLR